MRYLKQLIYEMRHQKMMTWISIIGTAVSIFLVMVMFMTDNLKTVEISPDNNRKRIYAGMGMDVRSEGSTMMADLSYAAAKRLYGDLEGVELTAYAQKNAMQEDVIIKGEIPANVATKKVDGNFWKLFDFKFIQGNNFTEDETIGNTDKIVISRSIAHRLFESEEVVGRELNIGGISRVVAGVVEDVNPIAQNAWAEVYLPLDSDERKEISRVYDTMGWIMALMLYEEGADPEAIKSEVKSRFATLNAELEKEGWEVVYKETPYSPEEIALSDEEEIPDATASHKKQLALYIVLILLPAINLSSMMRGRLQHRISEIGVRRAFGAKRLDIVAQLMGENLVITIAGAIIGLFLSYLFMMFLSSEFFMFVGENRAYILSQRMATPTFSMLFTWGAFFVAVVACLVLNILTATLPAWKAAMMNPAQAILKSKS